MRIKVNKWDLVKIVSTLEESKNLIDSGLRSIIEALIWIATERKSSGATELHRGLDRIYRALTMVYTAGRSLDKIINEAEYVREEGERDDSKDNGSF